MPKHRPIRFLEPSGFENGQEQIRRFIKNHPIAGSAMKAILALAAIGGVVTLAATAPGLMAVFGKEKFRHAREKRERYQQLWKSFYALKKKGHFEYKGEDKDGKSIYQLTEKGMSKVKKFTLETLELAPPAKWDGKWRLVIFDIPEKFKKTRRLFQRKLREMNFFPLQKSAFVHPFPCDAEIAFLKDLLQIHPFVEVFVTKEISSGRVLYYFRNILKEYL